VIGWLSGRVLTRDPSGLVLLETGGVGYELQVSLQTMASVPEVGQACELHVHTYPREDKLDLYGFGSAEEKRLFRMLISVPKVGPSNARAVLGGFPVTELVECLVQGDHAKLTKIPGIGKKTAEQIVLTLRDKMGPMLELVGTTTAEPTPEVEEGVLGEAKAVLVSLGWKPKPVDKALSELEVEPSASLDEVVRATLARLMER
jgi:Holliday junction DNA helicase RuvA